MKRVITLLLVLSIATIGCSSKENSKTPSYLSNTVANPTSTPAEQKQTVYNYRSPDSVNVATLSLNENDKTFTFSYDPLSSYLPYGSYSITKDILTATTNDLSRTYLFRILDKNQLEFVADGSSSTSLVDERIGTQVSNKTIFRLENNPDKLDCD